MPNRVDSTTDGKYPMNWMRMSTIWTDTGGKIDVRYTDPECVPGTAMPRYTRYSAAELRALVDYTAALPTVAGSRARWELGPGNAETGRTLFEKNCAGCHGDQGQGKTGPALGSAGFQKAATEAFVAATVMRGRAGTPMPAFGRASVSYPKLSPQEVLDLAAFVKRELGVKQKAAQPATTPGKTGG